MPAADGKMSQSFQALADGGDGAVDGVGVDTAPSNGRGWRTITAVERRVA